MADRANNKTIYAGMKLRTMNRSEFDDGLLRNNQRYDNRLQQEIQAVEKAQRIIAKGLDKESQFFRQRASVSSMTPTNTPRGAVKKNSFSEFGSYSGNEFPSNTRLIPDYQYQGKPVTSSSFSSATAAPAVYYDDETAKQPRRRDSKEDGGESRQRKTRDRGHGDRESSKSKKKSSRSKEGERKSRTEDGDKKSSRSSKSSHSRSAVDGEPAHVPSSDVTKEPSVDISGLSLASNGTPEKPSVQSSSSSSNNATTRDSARTSTVTTTTKSTHASAPATQQTLTTDNALAFGVTTTTPLSSTLARDLNWDGRRRYANVWDTLSAPAPRHTSTNRSVRARLEKELYAKESAEPRQSGKQ